MMLKLSADIIDQRQKAAIRNPIERGNLRDLLRIDDRVDPEKVNAQKYRPAKNSGGLGVDVLQEKKILREKAIIYISKSEVCAQLDSMKIRIWLEMADAIKEWEDLLEKYSKEIYIQLDEVVVVQKDIQARIDKERAECIEAINIEAQKLKKHLAQIQEDILFTAKERVEHQAIYDAKFVADFARLHKMLAAETKQREKQCKLELARMKAYYESLNISQSFMERDVRGVNNELTIELTVEEDDRKWCQNEVVVETFSFLDQFKKNIREDIAKQQVLNEERRRKMKEGHHE